MLLFMTATEPVWIFFFFLRDCHYVVITVTESPFHLQKGTEINNIFQNGSGSFISGDRNGGKGRKCPIHISLFAAECFQRTEVHELRHNISQIGSTEELMCEYQEENRT